MLKNAPTLAIRSVDTEENEPRQVHREIGNSGLVEISFAFSLVLAFELASQINAVSAGASNFPGGGQILTRFKFVLVKPHCDEKR